MRKDSKLSRMLHVLLHMAQENKTFTSEQISEMLKTNPVVVRRTISGLKKHGFVDSEKGPGGGWSLVKPLAEISLYDIYFAVGEPSILALGNENNNSDCLVEMVVNQALDEIFIDTRKLLINKLKATKLDYLAHNFQRALNSHIK